MGLKNEGIIEEIDGTGIDDPAHGVTSRAGVFALGYGIGDVGGNYIKPVERTPQLHKIRRISG